MAPDEGLHVAGVSVRHGRVPVLVDLDFKVGRGESVGLLGANGAGKTTLLNTLSGFLHPARGEMRLFGRRLDGLAPHQVVRRGLVQVSQERDLFGELTVLDNLRLGAMVRGRARLVENLARVFGYFPRLRERSGQRAATMSGGEQQMLAIGRALMARPTLLLLDEPSLGLAPLVVRKIFDILREVNAAGTTVFLVEQNAHMALTAAHRAYVLQTGHVIKTDAARNLLTDPDVRAAYLGG